MKPSAFKNLLLAPSADPVVEIVDLDVSMELDVADLLDIDGSDDQTLAVSKGVKLGGKRAARVAPVAAAPVQVVDADDARVTIPFGLEKHTPKNQGEAEKTGRPPAKSTISSPAHFAFAATPPKNPTPPSTRDVGSTFEPVSHGGPAHFAVNQPRARKVSASYPPVAIVVGGHREKALSFIQERPSRAGWIAAAVIAVVLVIGGSIRVQSVAPAASAQPAEFTPLPAAVEEAPKPVEATPAKVVQFAEDQGVAIKPKAATPAKHAAPAKPAAKPVLKAEPTLAKSEPKTEKPAPEKKKPAQSIDAELAEAQLRAAAR